MFLDASAAIAILAREEGHLRFAEKLATASVVLFSPLAYYETCAGLARSLSCHPADAELLVRKMLEATQAKTVDLTDETGAAAMRAHMFFGKGRHRASLNMGDCFAYACAKIHKVPLLCKGDDFIHTDIELA
jgi:ribonuclease VapC